MREIKTKAEFDEIIGQLENLLGYYEKSNLRGNRYRLFLANGDEYIDYAFNEANIPHLLGVDTYFVENEVLCRKGDSYTTLSRLIEFSFEAYRKINNNHAYNKVFSKYIDDKLEIFKRQFYAPYANNIEFICKYDREKNYSVKEEDGYKADYFIGRKNEKGDILLLGLVKSDEKSDRPIYVPQTSRVIRNDEDFQKNLMDFLNGQEITYATGLAIHNGEYRNFTSLNTVELNTVLSGLRSYMTIANAVPVTIDGHIYNIQTLSKNKQQSYNSKTIYRTIQDAIMRKELISLTKEEAAELDDIVLKLIDDHNNYMIATSNIDASKSEVYTGMKEERDSLRGDLEKIKEALAAQKEENDRLREEIEQHKQEMLAMQQSNEEVNEYARRILEINEGVIKKNN